MQAYAALKKLQHVKPFAESKQVEPVVSKKVGFDPCLSNQPACSLTKYLMSHNVLTHPTQVVRKNISWLRRFLLFDPDQAE